MQRLTNGSKKNNDECVRVSKRYIPYNSAAALPRPRDRKPSDAEHAPDLSSRTNKKQAETTK